MAAPTACASSEDSGTQHIIIVEDDPDIASMLVDLMTDGGFAASVAASGSDLDRLLGQRSADLVILDAMLPGEGGFSICRRLRLAGRTPILMLTALSEDIDRILGLELGADDYVTKPFNSRELLARIKGLLRRAAYGREPDQSVSSLVFAGWRLDTLARQLYDPDGVEVSMTTAEFDLLLAFCLHPGRVMTRKQLLGLTHAGTAGPFTRSIDVHVSRLRQKIEPDVREPLLIKTVRLGGYFFTPTVERA